MYSERRKRKFLRSENFILTADFRVNCKSCTCGISGLIQGNIERSNFQLMTRN